MTLSHLALIVAPLLLFCLTPALCAPPIRCVHQTTVVKDGKATTHLILTTAKPGEEQTVKNTADVVYPGSIGVHLYSLNEVLGADKIFSNADGSIVAVNFTPSRLGRYQTYLFLSSKRGIIVLREFTDHVARLLEDNAWPALQKTDIGRGVGSRSEKNAEWRRFLQERLQHELFVVEIERNILGITARQNEASDLDFTVAVESTGQLHLKEIKASSE